MENKESKYKENRDRLKELSKVAKMALKVMPDEYANVNDYVIRECYTHNGHTEFNTFYQWIQKGYAVKKGEKAFVIWGKPQKATEKKESEKDEFDFYPLCYLFSNLQVEFKTTRK